MDKLKKMMAAKAEKLAAMEQLINAAEDGILKADEQAKFDALKSEASSLTASISSLEATLADKAKNEAAMKNSPVPTAVNIGSEAEQPEKKIIVPAQAKRWSVSNMKAFKKAEDAYSAGMWLGASLGNKRALQWCNDHGVSLEAVSQGSNNTNGGYLVPEVLSSSIIELLNSYGMFRQNTTVLPMTSDTLAIPRRAGGLTAYFVNDDSAITESTKTWDLVRLIAKDAGVITRVANDLIGDAIIPIMDNLTNEMAYILAKLEDDCGFIGDGTSTYGGISGVNQRLISSHCTGGIATGAVLSGGGLVRYDTGYAWTNVALADITATMQLLPSYARMGAKFYVNPQFYHGVMLPLLTSVGGATGAEIVNGYGEPKFLGYPVVLCESMPATQAINTVYMQFGNLGLASKLGDRQQITIAASDSATVGGVSAFERNQIALRAVERFDINVHDVGVASTSAGAVVGLMSHTG